MSQTLQDVETMHANALEEAKLAGHPLTTIQNGRVVTLFAHRLPEPYATECIAENMQPTSDLIQ